MNRKDRRGAAAQQRAQYRRVQMDAAERAARFRAAGQDPGRTLEEIDADLKVCLAAARGDDGRDEAALEAKLDRLDAVWLEKFRAMGWSEDQISRYERERAVEFECGSRALESHMAGDPRMQALRKRALRRLRGF